LNVDISTVAELRETCRRREAFLDDVKRAHGYSKSSPFRREISELIPESESQKGSESENELEVDAFTLKCWNCRKDGHIYQDCLADKRLFCYGCGAGNTYKSNCAVCKKLQVRRFEVAVQTENFECLSQPVNDDRLNVDVPFVTPQIIPDVPESNASSLLHCKVKNLPDIPNPKFCLNPLLKKCKSRSSKRIKSFWQNIGTCRLGLKYIYSVPIETRDPFCRFVY